MSITATLYTSLTDTTGQVSVYSSATDFLTNIYTPFPAGTCSNVVEQVAAKAAGTPLPDYKNWQARTKMSLPLYRFSTESSRASGASPGMMTALVVEIDAGNGAPDDALGLLLAATEGYEAVLMTSTGHSEQYPAVRLVMPLSPAIPANMYESLVAWMQQKATGATGGASWLSKQEMNATRAWFAPAGYEEIPGIRPILVDPDGVPLDWRTLGLPTPAPHTAPANDGSTDDRPRMVTSDLAATESKCSFARAARDDAEMPYPLWLAALMLWRGSFLATADGEVTGQALVDLRETGRFPERYLTGRSLADKVAGLGGSAPRKETIAAHWAGCATCPLAATCSSPIQHGEASRDDLSAAGKLVARMVRALATAVSRAVQADIDTATENLREARDQEAQIRARLQSAAASAVPGNVIRMANGNDTEMAKLWLRSNPDATCTSDLTALMVPEAGNTGFWKVLDLGALGVHFQAWQGDGIHRVVGAIDPATGQPKLTPLSVDLMKSEKAAASVLNAVVTKESTSRGVQRADLPEALASGPRGGVLYRSGRVGYDGSVTPITLQDRATRNDVMPGQYNPSATAPRFMQFLDGLFETCSPAHRDSYKASIQEVVGASLAGQGTRVGKLLLLTGDGCNGKSTLLAVVRRLFNACKVGSVQPASINDERHRTSLMDKHINIIDDMSSKYLGETGALKTMITGDNLVLGRRLHHEVFSFKPRTGWIAGINTLPTVTDTSDGFWRRVLVVPCNTSFLGREDRMLGDTLVGEQDGIVAWAVAGLVRVAGNGWHTTEIPADAVTEWRESANTLTAFCKDCITVPENSATTPRIFAKTLYRVYCDWCGVNGVTERLPSVTFGRSLPMNIKACWSHTMHGKAYAIVLVDCQHKAVRADFPASQQTAEA